MGILSILLASRASGTHIGLEPDGIGVYIRGCKRLSTVKELEPQSRGPGRKERAKHVTRERLFLSFFLFFALTPRHLKAVRNRLRYDCTRGRKARARQTNRLLLQAVTVCLAQVTSTAGSPRARRLTSITRFYETRREHSFPQVRCFERLLKPLGPREAMLPIRSVPVLPALVIWEERKCQV